MIIFPNSRFITEMFVSLTIQEYVPFLSYIFLQILKYRTLLF